jgi:hypothetical protein
VADSSPLQHGDPVQVGQYRLLGCLGAGGQGTVYLGESPSGQLVAVKMLHARLSRDERARRNFLGEVDAAQRVRQFCTARVLDIDTEGTQPYIVSEYVEGPSLAALVRSEGPRDPDALERLAVATITALAAIHQVGIVHRDFKPSNVICGTDGPRVIDFGIARVLDATTTTSSSVMGTPAYMSPEQVSARGVGPASDVFSWAATMLFAATGRAPFGSDTIPATFYRILNTEPDLVAPTEPLRSVIAECLAKDPADRPAATDVLLALLGHDSVNEAVGTALEPIVMTGAPPAPGRPANPASRTHRRTARRISTATLTVSAAAVTAVAGAVLLYFLWPSGAPGTPSKGSATGGASPTVADVKPTGPAPTVVGVQADIACGDLLTAGYLCTNHYEPGPNYQIVNRQELSGGSVNIYWSPWQPVSYSITREPGDIWTMRQGSAARLSTSSFNVGRGYTPGTRFANARTVNEFTCSTGCQGVTGNRFYSTRSTAPGWVNNGPVAVFMTCGAHGAKRVYQVWKDTTGGKRQFGVSGDPAGWGAVGSELLGCVW